jgi:hypothetical protein
MYRQGDVLLIEVPPERESLSSAREVARDAGRIVLAYGEVTGHAHAIVDSNAKLFEAPSGRILVVESGSASVVHEEHTAVTLPAGKYLVRRQREYVPGSAGSVQVGD